MARSLGQIIQGLRKANSLSQEDLASLMGMPQNSGRALISYWESDKRKPTEAQLEKLAVCLGYWQFQCGSELRKEIIRRALVSASQEMANG